MATIYQRTQNGSFYIDWREDGRRRQRSLKTRDRKIAERELRRLEARLALGVTDLPNAGNEPISLEKFATRYQDHLRPRRSESYCFNVQRVFQMLAGELGDPLLGQIHARDIEEHVTRLAGVYATATVNVRIKILRAAFNVAIRWGHLAKNPTEGIKFLKDPASDHRVAFLSEDEVGRLLEMTAGTRLHDIFATLFFTGIRRGELVHLWWEDIDFEDGLIHVRIKDWQDDDGVQHQWFPKGRRERTIPMHPRLREILARQPRRGRFVFTNERGRTLDRGLDYMVGVFRKKSGWRVTCHLLRHTFASHLVQKGVSLYVVGELLGHSGPNVTKIYAHLVPKRLGHVIRLLGTDRRMEVFGAAQ